jgi:hypothetical protein
VRFLILGNIPRFWNTLVVIALAFLAKKSAILCRMNNREMSRNMIIGMRSISIHYKRHGGGKGAEEMVIFVIFKRNGSSKREK